MDNPYHDLILRYCEGNISPEDERKLLGWIRQHEDNALIFKETERRWKQNHRSTLAAKFAVEKARARVRRTYLGVAGVLTAVLSAVVFLTVLLPGTDTAADPRDLILNSPDAVCVRAPMSSISEISLPDGTKVWLNSGTELRYTKSFNSKDRNIYLKGEGYFEVAHNKALPFNVFTDEIKITALGTKFNVFAYEGEQRAFAALLDGCISFEAGEEYAVLAPGMLASYEKNTIDISSVDAGQYISWINGEIKYDEISLPEFLNRLSRLYIRDISYDRDILSSRKFRAAFTQDENLDDILKAITYLLPVKVNSDKGKYTVTASNE